MALIQIHPPGQVEPAVGFEQPFDMLHACHERVERMLRLLEKIAQHWRDADLQSQVAQAARDVMRYFDQAGPEHHRDEERHLLPLLAASSDPAVRAWGEQIQTDHAQMHALWLCLRSDLQVFVDASEKKKAVVSAPEALHWETFAALYRQHIELEEGQAYPWTKRQLGAQAQQAMGQEMAARRGLGQPIPRTQ